MKKRIGCLACKKTGYVRAIIGGKSRSIQCPDCLGSGVINICHRCLGIGRCAENAMSFQDPSMMVVNVCSLCHGDGVT